LSSKLIMFPLLLCLYSNRNGRTHGEVILARDIAGMILIPEQLTSNEFYVYFFFALMFFFSVLPQITPPKPHFNNCPNTAQRGSVFSVGQPHDP